MSLVKLSSEEIKILIFAIKSLNYWEDLYIDDGPNEIVNYTKDRKNRKSLIDKLNETCMLKINEKSLYWIIILALSVLNTGMVTFTDWYMEEINIRSSILAFMIFPFLALCAKLFPLKNKQNPKTKSVLDQLKKLHTDLENRELQLDQHIEEYINEGKHDLAAGKSKERHLILLFKGRLNQIISGQ